MSLNKQITLRDSLSRPLTSSEVDSNFQFLLDYIDAFSSKNGFFFYSLDIESNESQSYFMISSLPDFEYLKIKFNGVLFDVNYDSENGLSFFSSSLGVNFSDFFVITPDRNLYFKAYSDVSLIHKINIWCHDSLFILDELGFEFIDNGAG